MSVEKRNGIWGVRLQRDGKEIRRSLGVGATREDAVALQRALRQEAVQQRQARVAGRPLTNLRAAKVHCLYRHFNKDDDLLYVGISLSAMTRLLQHQSCAAWFDEIVTVRIERFATRAEVRAAEALAIATERPRHNIARPPEKVGRILADAVGQTGQFHAAPVHV